MKNNITSLRISGSTLKLIAIITMLIDHTAAFILSGFGAFSSPFLTLLGKDISVYYLCRLIGRLSFPIYCFLLTEGFIHTRDRKSYGLRLLVFALISELPWNFIHTGGMLYARQNVMFTLLLGFAALTALDYFKGDNIRRAAALLLVFLITYFANVDYGTAGLALILVFYLLKSERAAQAIVGTAVLGNLYAGLAFIPINLYNGERGFMRGAAAKYAGYLFNPIHLFLLGILRAVLF